jgi:hypothetical protein
LFQVSIPIQPGNSGGPVFNEKGELIGIATSSIDSVQTQKVFGATPQNVNFAIKSAYINSLLPNLPETFIKPRGIVPVPREVPSFKERVKNDIVLVEAVPEFKPTAVKRNYEGEERVRKELDVLQQEKKLAERERLRKEKDEERLKKELDFLQRERELAERERLRKEKDKERLKKEQDILQQEKELAERERLRKEKDKEQLRKEKDILQQERELAERERLRIEDDKKRLRKAQDVLKKERELLERELELSRREAQQVEKGHGGGSTPTISECQFDADFYDGTCEGGL